MNTPTPRNPEGLAAADKLFGIPAGMPPTEGIISLLLSKAYADGMAAQRLLSDMSAASGKQPPT